jgi:hypothetical protein
MLYGTVHRTEESALARKLAVDTHYNTDTVEVWAHAHNSPDLADETAYVLPEKRWATSSSVAILIAVPLTPAEQTEGCYTVNLGEGAASSTPFDAIVPPDSWQF